MAIALAPLLATQAAAQSRSGIIINSDVLNSLGPGPQAVPFAPLPQDAQPSSQAPAYQAPTYPAPAAPGGTFQPYMSGGVVVTRPGTLLFPPLREPDSTLTPGFAGEAANHAARARAMRDAFAEGPEPNSQLLIPLGGPAAGSDSVIVFMDALPPADPQADASSAPRLTLRQPPQPAPRKPSVPAQTLADLRQRTPQVPADLAPEFAAPQPTEVADLPPAEASEPVMAETPADTAPAAQASSLVTAAAETSTTETALAETLAAEEPEVETPVAQTPPAATAVAEAPVVVTPVSDGPAGNTPEAVAPVSLLPAASDAPARVQTASLTVGAFEDTSLLFESDSAELSAEAQDELRSIAKLLRSSEGADIQVLGFAAGSDGSDDQARKLALSRALKVRSFLIDEGIASARIRVRSLGASAEGGPANRVDIRPVGS